MCKFQLASKMIIINLTNLNWEGEVTFEVDIERPFVKEFLLLFRKFAHFGTMYQSPTHSLSTCVTQVNI